MNLGRSLRRWRHFRAFGELYDPVANERSLGNLLNALKSAKVAVVGNAQSILDNANGADIDSHDVVVRLNRGLITEPAAQGKRSDILGLACNMTHAEVAEAFGTPRIVWLTPIRELMANDLLRRRTELSVVPIPHWMDLKRQIDEARPSAGLIVLNLLLHYSSCERIDLYGFDWKASKTLYHSVERHEREGVKRRWHDWELERRLVEKWSAEEDRLRIH